MLDNPSVLLSFLNNHSQGRQFTLDDIRWMFQERNWARIFNRVIPLTLIGSHCVLGEHELKV